MVNFPEEIRQKLYKKSIKEPFYFPKAVAYLLCVVYEPRKNNSSYPDVINNLIKENKEIIKNECEKVQKQKKSFKKSTGEIEKICLNRLDILHKKVSQFNIEDICSILEYAKQVSYGYEDILYEKREIIFPNLPERKVSKKGQIPIGFWR